VTSIPVFLKRVVIGIRGEASAEKVRKGKGNRHGSLNQKGCVSSREWRRPEGHKPESLCQVGKERGSAFAVAFKKRR